MDEARRQYHEVANIFPLMQGDEYAALKADIAEHGLREPIWLHPDESIIDGRNRHRACVELGITPAFETWNGRGSLVAFVVSLNLHRRHLTSSQQAAVAIKIEPMIAEELEQERQAAREVETVPFAATSVGQRIAQAGVITRDMKPTEVAARLTGTNRQYVSDAKNLQANAPDLLKEVETGAKTIPQAKRELQKRQKREAPPLPTEKYRVLYTDPPWHYGNSGVIGDTDNYGRAERHYPTMRIDELCAMGAKIKEITDDNAVLFMWVTSPLLEECFAVIRAWGFKYKTSFVWDKVKHNFGHYNSVRHEFLLVCTRGSCTPDMGKLYDSVVECERSKTHSEKPEIFREMIDELYPNGKRIELFARKHVDRWETWGNE